MAFDQWTNGDGVCGFETLDKFKQGAGVIRKDYTCPSSIHLGLPSHKLRPHWSPIGQILF